MNKEIKQLQKEAREEYDNCIIKSSIITIGDFYEYQDKLIKKTYNKARKDLIEEIKKAEPSFSDLAIEKELHNRNGDVFSKGYYQAIDDIIKGLK